MLAQQNLNKVTSQLYIKTSAGLFLHFSIGIVSTANRVLVSRNIK